MLARKILPAFLLPALFASAQNNGYWRATPYPHQIMRLTWQPPGMQRTEQVSNAVVLTPAGPETSLPDQLQLIDADPRKQSIFPAELPGSPQVSPNATGGVTVLDGQYAARFLNGFDSGHVRGVRLLLNPEARWMGGGERATGLYRNGQRISLYNAPQYGYEEGQDQLNFSVPFFMSTEGFGLFFDNPSKGYMDFGRATPGVLEAGFVSGRLDVYVIPGQTPAEILERYTLLTGRQPLPPRWVFGHFASRFGYRSQRQTEDVVNRLMADSFPLDAVVIDLFWFGDSIQRTLGNLEWKRDKWPQPERMMQRFAQRNIRTILVTEPFVLEGTRQFAAAQPHLATDSLGKPYRLTDFYFGQGGLLDLFKPSAQQWFWQFYRRQTDRGVSGWWGDLGEPEKHPSDMYHDLSDRGLTRRMAADEVHNLYGHTWSEMLYRNWRQTYPNRRLFFLNRSGFAGSQRFSIFPWTGDVSRSWSGLRAQLPILQGMSLSGIPYLHSDAGGFSMTDRKDPELYLRWLQLAAWTPVFRPHGTALGADLTPAGVLDLPSEPVFWEEPVRSQARRLIRERYRLLPYFYTMAWQQTMQGRPLIRPMIFEHPQDTALLKATDQFYLGDAFVVAPILYPGMSERFVTLPAGTWYDARDTRVIRSNGTPLTIPVDTASIPVFARAGSVVPRWESATPRSTAEYGPATTLTLQWYPGTDSLVHHFYDDDGTTPGAEQVEGKHQLLRLTNAPLGRQSRLRVEAVQWPKGQNRILRIGVPISYLQLQGLPLRAMVNGQSMILRADAERRWVYLTLPYNGQTMTMGL